MNSVIKWYELEDNKDRIKTFNVLLGGRGIGKTDSSLRYAIKRDGRFIYMRNTQAQLDKSVTDAMNPFKQLNSRLGYNIRFEINKENYLILSGGDEENDIEPNLLGYAVSLSTFENLRGVDFSDVNTIIFDEFIQRRKLQFQQYKAFCEMYETVNRNRELIGLEPVQVFFLSNTQDIYNDILMGFGWINYFEAMLRSGQKNASTMDCWFSLCSGQNISELKRNTVLYRNMPDDAIKEEYIENQFANNDLSRVVKKIKIDEFRCICSIDNIYILKHKSRDIYHVTFTKYTTLHVFKNRIKFLKAIGLRLRSAYYENKITFSSLTVMNDLLTLIDV